MPLFTYFSHVCATAVALYTYILYKSVRTIFVARVYNNLPASLISAQPLISQCAAPLTVRRSWQHERTNLNSRLYAATTVYTPLCRRSATCVLSLTSAMLPLHGMPTCKHNTERSTYRSLHVPLLTFTQE